jgi:hypothetical protein
MFTRNSFQIGYEYFFKPTSSFQINAGVRFKESEYEQYWGVVSDAQLRYHVNTLIQPQNSHRLYFAPYIAYIYEEKESNIWNANGYQEWVMDSYTALGSGVLFGWSFSFANRINLDIYTGGGIRKAFGVEHDFDNTVWDYSFSGIAPRLGIDIGFWF